MRRSKCKRWRIRRPPIPTRQRSQVLPNAAHPSRLECHAFVHSFCSLCDAYSLICVLLSPLARFIAAGQHRSCRALSITIMTLEASFARTRTESSLRPSPSASAWQPLHNPIAPASFNAAMSEAAIMAAMGLPTGFVRMHNQADRASERASIQRKACISSATPDQNGGSSATVLLSNLSPAAFARFCAR